MGERRIVLTPEEVREIARKQEIASALLACGAFDVRGGSITLHFDLNGKLRKVDRNDTIYRGI